MSTIGSIVSSRCLDSRLALSSGSGKRYREALLELGYFHTLEMSTMSNKLCLCSSQKRRVIVWLHLRKRPTFSRVNDFLICDLQMNRIPGRSDFRGKQLKNLR